MRLPRLDVLIGDVLKVQMASETHVAGGATETSPLAVSSSVVHRMRIFMRLQDGKERDVLFANAKIGVREGHHVAIALAKPPASAMRPVLLANLSTGQREEYREAFADVVRQKIVHARLRAGAAALVLSVGYYLFAHLFQPDGDHLWPAIGIGLLGFGALWGVFAAIDAVVLPRQEKQLMERLRAEIEGRIAIAERKPAPSPSLEAGPA